MVNDDFLFLCNEVPKYKIVTYCTVTLPSRVTVYHQTRIEVLKSGWLTALQKLYYSTVALRIHLRWSYDYVPGSRAIPSST